MGALLAHVAAGLLWGFAAWAIADRAAKRTRIDAGIIIALPAAAALVGDLDTWIGTHRVTTHNLWLLGVAPALVASLVATLPGLRDHPVAAAAHVVPAASMSELWLDVFGPSLSGAAALWWPFQSGHWRSTGAEAGPGDLPVLDDAAFMFVGLTWSLAVALLHRRVVAAQTDRSPSGGASAPVALAIGTGHALLVVAPWFVLAWAGALVPA